MNVNSLKSTIILLNSTLSQSQVLFLVIFVVIIMLFLLCITKLCKYSNCLIMPYKIHLYLDELNLKLFLCVNELHECFVSKIMIYLQFNYHPNPL